MNHFYSLLAGLTALASSISNASGAGFTPIPLTATSYNEDVVIEKTAPAPPTPLTTASMDAGTANTGYSWYELGFNPDAPDTGLPVAGSTLTSETLPDHSYRLAASYTANNAVLVDNSLSNVTVTVTTPAPFSSLSLLTASGHGPVTLGYSIQHADGSTETNSVVSLDWFDGTDQAFTANGRVDVASRAFDSVSSGNPRLYSIDIPLSNTTSPVSAITFTLASGAGHIGILAISGSSGAGFTPVAFTGYNADMVAEASAPPLPTSLNATTASMDAGTANTGASWFEQGYISTASTNGLPAPGSTLTNTSAADHLYALPASYTTNNAVLVDSSMNGVITFASPASYSALSFLTAAGGGAVTINYTIHQGSGVTQEGSFISPDWFNNTPVAFTASGRASVATGAPDVIETDNPRLYAVDIAVTNTASPISSIDLNYGTGTGHAVVLAVSGAAGSVKPIIDVQPVSTNVFSGGTIALSVSASGTAPLTYQWQRGSNGTFSDIAGATSATLSLNNLTAANQGQYRLVVTNAAGSTTSSVVTVAVLSNAPDLTSPTDEITSVGGTSPDAEAVANAIDNTTSKYLNFGTDNDQNPPFVGPVGLVLTLAGGSNVVSGLRIYTANDVPDRDPTDYKLEASNDAGATYTLISSGALALPEGRNPTGQPLDPLTQFNQEVSFPNSTAYSTYRLTFTNVKNNTAANSMQIGEVELLGPGGTVSGPTVSIARTAAGALTITSSQPGTLQSTTSLGGTNVVWQNEGPISGSVTVNPTGRAKFYRVVP